MGWGGVMVVVYWWEFIGCMVMVGCIGWFIFPLGGNLLMVVWVVLEGYIGWGGVKVVVYWWEVIGCMMMVGLCWVVHIRLGGNLLMVVWVVLEGYMGWCGVGSIGSGYGGGVLGGVYWMG